MVPQLRLVMLISFQFHFMEVHGFLNNLTAGWVCMHGYLGQDCCEFEVA